MKEVFLVIALIVGVILLLALVAHIFFMSLLSADLQSESKADELDIQAYKESYEYTFRDDVAGWVGAACGAGNRWGVS